MERTISRGKFIRYLLPAAFSASSLLAYPALALGCETVVDQPATDTTNSSEPPVVLAKPTILDSWQTNFSSLVEFQEYVSPYKQHVAAVLEQYAAQHFNIFSRPGVKGWSPEQNVLDWDFFGEMYLAAQLKYGVPALLLWPTHLQESGCSTAILDYRFLGPMRISPMHYDQNTPLRQALLSAHQGCEFLGELPQRFYGRLINEGPDWVEILKGAAFIDYHAHTVYPALYQTDKEAAIIKALLNNYSGVDYGQQRTLWYTAHKATLSIL